MENKGTPMNHYYGPNAYRSNVPRAQAPQQQMPHNGARHRLPWGNAGCGMPSNLLSKGMQELMCKEAELFKPYQPNVPRDKWSVINHEYMEPADVSKLSIILNYLFAAGKYMAIPATVITTISLLVLFFKFSDTSLLERISSFITIFLITPGIFYLLWGIGTLVLKYCPQLLMLKGNGKITWRLNRRTGMVTKFDYKDGEVKEISAPFDEFDAYLYYTLTRHGFLYDMFIYHRYDRWTFSIAEITGLKPSKEEAKNSWDFIQNYMDVSKPLPETPVFEPYRHLDPTTAAYDQATHRNPRKLLDLPEEELIALQDQSYNAHEAMDRRHCVFQEGGYVKYLPAAEYHPEAIEEEPKKEESVNTQH